MADGQNIEKIGINNLLLDLDNPRLPEDIAVSNQKQAFEHIIERYDIDELVQAIGENDYFAGEPLIVIPSEEDSGKYTVVEGNRRLSALKVLNDPNLAKKYHLRNLAKKAEDAKHKPKKIPCVKFDNREKVLSYLGLRHISGVKSWDLIAKARYIRKLFDRTDESLNISERVLSVTRSIGSKSDYIRRNLLTLYIYNIIKDNDFFELKGVSEKNFQSYVFYRAISNLDIRDFVGIPNDFRLDFADKMKMKNLKLIVKIICERDDKERTVLGNPRHLNDLAEIVTEPKAVEKLRQTNSIKEALRILNSAAKEFVSNLYKAKNLLGDAQNNIQETSVIDNKREIDEVIEIIKERLKVIEERLKKIDD